ncbi:methyltransferase domain-containing protein [Limoniibacter endophyticus]|uniref:SAM-dependent methyltransferase n=1 Tax=Limoniibacter endophyticus TaxID=1565040 RepID=A0A8J3DKA2_9HYPH|nr:methyltransferase domain-containing protein [Limoniibacter endophyticus]GHC76166.1 SAM-dependent methyltransferase [Limoniibacter endophyticus]
MMETVFDDEAYAAHKARAHAMQDRGAWYLLDRAVEELSDRLSLVERRFERAALIQSQDESIAEAVMGTGKVTQVVRVECTGSNGILATEDDHLPLEPESMDLAISVLSMQSLNDLPGFLVQIRRALKPDGLFLACLAGAGTLAELRESLMQAEVELTGGARPRIHPFADVRDMGALLQRAGFKLPVADIEPVTVRFGSAFSLMKDLRAMGETNVLAERQKSFARRTLFFRTAQTYAEKFGEPDGKIRATFNVVWLSGWAAHASQQQPLKPGSAKASLEDALKKFQ